MALVVAVIVTLVETAESRSPHRFAKNAHTVAERRPRPSPRCRRVKRGWLRPASPVPGYRREHPKHLALGLRVEQNETHGSPAATRTQDEERANPKPLRAANSKPLSPLSTSERRRRLSELVQPLDPRHTLLRTNARTARRLLIKKLSTVGGDLAIIIERPMLALLDITEETPLEVKTDGAALIIRPVKLSQKERIRESTKKMMATHEETLQKLAK